MIYIYYNLQLSVKQLERTPEVDAIFLENIDIIFEWKVESERAYYGEAPEWLEEVQQA
jgi:hypothetical protein